MGIVILVNSVSGTSRPIIYICLIISKHNFLHRDYWLLHQDLGLHFRLQHSSLCQAGGTFQYVKRNAGWSSPRFLFSSSGRLYRSSLRPSFRRRFSRLR